jgi:methanethiol S-methyltransferase
MRAIGLRVLGALALFAGLHSLLASRRAKDTAAALLGSRARNALYRPFFIVQSAITLAALLAYLARLPDQVVYRVRAPWSRLLNLAQLAGLAYAAYAAAEVGWPRITGLTSLAGMLRRAEVVPAEPEAQGPAPDAWGQLRARGPFVWSRHPLNFAPLPIFWLSPTQTVRSLWLGLGATLYLVLGSWHEEARLRTAYGQPYEDYRRSGVPFYVPRPRRRPLTFVSHAMPVEPTRYAASPIVDQG